MSIKIRLIQTHDEYLAAEQIQRETWRKKDIMIVPSHLLITVQKNSGLVLGAFEVLPEEGKERLIGFVFGFVGLTPDGKMKHCSHMAGVTPAYQNQNVGYRLKLAQREHVLAQGMDLITWTFDLLESRNGYLNFRKLGGTCRTYLRDLYGSMRDGLNFGMPSDRLQVDWHIASDHVAGRLRGDRVVPSASLRTGPSASLRTGPSLSALQAEGVPVLNRFPSGDMPRPPQASLPIEGDRLFIQIPARFQVIKLADLGLALAWREHTRALFEAAFAAGYTVVDLLFENEQSCYLLRKDWTSR